MDEASGTRFDSHTNHLDLTAVNNPGSVSGNLGDAVNLVGASNQYLKRANESLIQVGGKDFTMAGWCRRNADANGIIASRDNVGNQAYDLQSYNGGTQGVFYTSGGPQIALNASHPVTTWFFVCVWFDSTAQQGFCSVNNGTAAQTAAGVGTISSSNSSLLFGNRWEGALENFDGYLQQFGYWISDPGDGGMLTATQMTNLYNGGTGITYPFVGVA